MRRIANNYDRISNGVSYDAIHKWVYARQGKATYCSNDVNHKSNRYEWSNISGEYRRDINDYRPLCVSCHRRLDMTEKSLKLLKERAVKLKVSNRKAVLQFTKDGIFVKAYSSIDEAAGKIGVSCKRLDDSLNGWRKTAGGYIWKFSDPLQEARRVEKATKNKEKYLESARVLNEKYRNRKRAAKSETIEEVLCQ